MREIERRFVLPPGGIEIRAAEGDKPPVLTGYAAVFDVESEDLGGFREIVRRTAFDRSLRDGVDVLARAHHDSRDLLGRTSAKTARLNVDEHGLRYEVDVPDTTTGRDVTVQVKRGDIRHSSFAFYLPLGGDVWENHASDGLPLRELIDVDLVDVAPVVNPAYAATEVSARALEEARAHAPAPAPTPALASPPAVPMSVNEAQQRLGES